MNSREAARRPLPFDILKRASRWQKKIKSLFDIFICIHDQNFKLNGKCILTRARRCHFCMGICKKSRDCDRIID